MSEYAFSLTVVKREKSATTTFVTADPPTVWAEAKRVLLEYAREIVKVCDDHDVRTYNRYGDIADQYIPPDFVGSDIVWNDLAASEGSIQIMIIQHRLDGRTDKKDGCPATLFNRAAYGDQWHIL